MKKVSIDPTPIWQGEKKLLVFTGMILYTRMKIHFY